MIRISGFDYVANKYILSLQQVLDLIPKPIDRA